MVCQATGGDQETFTCRGCEGTATYGDISSSVTKMVESLKVEVRGLDRQVAEVKMELAGCQGKMVGVYGKARLEMQRILSDVVKVRKFEFHSGGYVGKHCDKIVDKYEVFAPLLDDFPEQKKLFLELGAAYKPVHFYMKRNGFLTEEEIQEIENCCAKMGQLIPALYGGSIPPKVDDLIFVVPAQAREYKTLGIFREEKLEAMHNIVNVLSRVLACVRRAEERMRQVNWTFV